jgi:hypothetical protein
MYLTGLMPARHPPGDQNGSVTRMILGDLSSLVTHAVPLGLKCGRTAQGDICHFAILPFEVSPNTSRPGSPHQLAAPTPETLGASDPSRLNLAHTLHPGKSLAPASRRQPFHHHFTLGAMGRWWTIRWCYSAAQCMIRLP